MQTIRIAVLAALAAFSLLGQSPVTLTLGNARATSNRTFALDLALSNGPTTALQWTFTYVPGTISNVKVELGPSGLAAGKAISCAPLPATDGSTTCVLANGTNTIANGVVARLSGQLTSAQSNVHAGVNVSRVVAVDSAGVELRAVGYGGYVDRIADYTTLPLTFIRATSLGRGLSFSDGVLSAVPTESQRGEQGPPGAMGPAGPPGAGASFKFVDDDTAAVVQPDGRVLLTYPPAPASSLRVTQNGLRLKQGVDFTLSGNVVTFRYNAPVPAPDSGIGDILTFEYRY